MNSLQQIINLVPTILGNIQNKLQLIALALVLGSGTYITTIFIQDDQPIVRELTKKDVSTNKAEIEQLRINIEADAIVIYKRNDRGMTPIYTTPEYESKDLLAFYEEDLFTQIALGNCIKQPQSIFDPKLNVKLDSIVCPIGRKGAISAGFVEFPPKRTGIDSNNFDPLGGILWNFGESLLEQNN